MILSDSVAIRTTPETIFEWFAHLDDHYKEWHPDHISCTWITEPMREGSVLHAEEYIHGDVHAMDFRFTKVEPTRLEYKILFPVSIICPRGSFVVEPEGDSCIFTATLSFRFTRLLSFLFPERVDALRTHMREEGENLKKLLESQEF